jgi:endonuclease YncB( thermonuclease family)
MKSIFFIALAIMSLAGCDQDNLPRQAVAYDQKFTPAVPLIQTTIHGKPIVKTFTAKVNGVTDGDTIKVLNAENQQIKVRLEAIDCPESKQAFGTKAKQAMGDLMFGNSVTVLKTGTDRYGGLWRSL